MYDLRKLYLTFSNIFLVHKKMACRRHVKTVTLSFFFLFVGDCRVMKTKDQRPIWPSSSSSNSSPCTKIVKKDREFQQVWFEKYLWLLFEKDCMFCGTWILAKASLNSFSKGCLNFQNSPLTWHEQSKVHLQVICVQSRSQLLILTNQMKLKTIMSSPCC